MRYLYLSILMLILGSSSAWASACVWNTNSTGNWSTSGNWTTCGGNVPQTGDSVTFNGTGTGNCTIDVATNSVTTFSMNSGYTGAVTQSSSLTTTSDFTLAAGTFNNNATFNIGGNFTYSGGTWASNSSGIINFNSSSNQTYNTNGTALSFQDFKSSESGASRINLSGTAGTTVKGNLTIGTGGYVSDNASNTFSVAGDVTNYNTTTASNMPITFNGTGTQNLTLSHYQKTTGTVNVNKTAGTMVLLSATGGYEAPFVNINTGIFDINGWNIYNGGGGRGFTINSGGVLQVRGAETMGVNSGLTPSFAASASTMTFNGTAGPYLLQDWTYKTVQINGGATAVFSQKNVAHAAIPALIITQGVFYTEGCTAGVTKVTNNGGTLRMQGGETSDLNGSTMNTDNGTVEYVGANSASTYTIKDFGANDYYNLKINDTNGTKATFQTGGALTVSGALTVTSGTMDASGQNLTVNGGVNINGGTLTAPTPTASRSLSVATSWAHSSGTFTKGSGKVTFSNTSDITISGGTTFYDLAGDYHASAAAHTITIGNGTTQTIANTINMQGTSGQLLTLNSDTTGQWTIVMPATANQTLQYLSVKYSNNTGTQPNSNTGSSGCGDTNWFPASLNTACASGGTGVGDFGIDF